jgi:hypothetical protein
VSGSLSRLPDVALSASSPSTATVSIEATSVTPGTTAKVRVRAESGAETVVDSTPLAGTQEASTATASVALPDGPFLITATVSVDAVLPHARRIYADGEVVARIEMSMRAGGKQAVTYITQSGRRVTLD